MHRRPALTRSSVTALGVQIIVQKFAGAKVELDSVRKVYF